MNNRVLEYYIRAKDFTRGVLGNVAGRIKNFAFSVGRNLMNIKAGFEMLKKAAQALAKPLMVAFRREAITVQFAVLFRSLKQAKEHMKDLADFAAKTPFQMEGIAEASRMLYVFSAGALGTKDTLRLIGDAASATGNRLEELSTWVGRAFSKISGGKEFGREAMRLQELGVLTPQVRQAMEELQAAGASSAEVWLKLRDSLEQYQGGMEAASRTGEGLKSTLQDVGTEAMNTFGKSFMESAKGGLRYFIDLITELTENGTIERWAERTKNLLLSVFGAMKGLSEASTRAEAWEAIKDVLIGGFETGAVKAVNILGKYLPTFGAALGKAMKDGVLGIGKTRKMYEEAAAQRDLNTPGMSAWKVGARSYARKFYNPKDWAKKGIGGSLDSYASDMEMMQAQKYGIKTIKGSDRLERGLASLQSIGSGFEEVGKSLEFSEEDFKRKTAGSDTERVTQRQKEVKALMEAEESLRAGAELKRIEDEKQARLKLEQELSEERIRLQSKEISQRITESTEAERKMASQLDRAKAQVAQAWGWYRDKEGLKAQLEEEKDEAAARKQFDKDFERLQFRKRDWRTAKNLSLDDEAVRRVGVAMEEEAAAKRAVIETAENTRKLNEKFDAVISMKGG